MQDRSAATQLEQAPRTSRGRIASAETPPPANATTKTLAASAKAPAQSSDHKPVDLMFAATASIALWAIIIALLIWLL